MSAKNNKRVISIGVAAALALTAGAVAVTSSPERAAAEQVSAVYRLTFEDKTDLGKNTAADGAIGGSVVIDNGGITVNDNAWKGMPELNLHSSGNKQNYVQVPINTMNCESVTIAGWFKSSSGMPTWSRLFEIHDGRGNNGSWMSAMPYAPNYYNGLHVNMKVNGEQKNGVNGADNFIFQGADSSYGDGFNTPVDVVLPVYDAWTHYAYEFTPDGFYIYQNGKLVVSKDGNFTASQFYGENGKFVLGATDMWNDADWTGSISDFRIYDSALSGGDIINEFDITYADLLTASYDFENGGGDAVRGYGAELVGNAEIGQTTDHGNALILDGSGTGSDRTSAKLPVKSIMGHREISVSLDAYVDSKTGNYSRIFEFAEFGPQYLSLDVKRGGNKACLCFTDKEGERNQLLMFDIPYDKWFNVCVTLDGSTAAAFIDGMPVAYSDSFNYFNKIYWDFAGAIRLSLGTTGFYGDTPLTGKLDNFKIYQTALTEKEVMIDRGIITEPDDVKAVDSESEKFRLDYDGGTKLEIPSYAGEGVKLSWTSDRSDIIAADGTVLRGLENVEVNITVTFTRGEATVNRAYKVTVKANDLPDASLFRMSDLGAATLDKSSYYYRLMEVNLDYMMSLDKDRLLYNYRRIAGLDTMGKASYGAWISPTSGGAGQFEAHYVTALAKATQTMPDYTYNGETALDRLTYMVTELKKCQDAFALKHPEEAGYLGAISSKQYDALVTGDNRVTDDDGTVSNVWVPWYFYHKQIEAVLDAYNYSADGKIRAVAFEMLNDAADWAYKKMNGLTETERAKVLRVEYGGMAEVLYQTYTVTGNADHFNAAKYFEEKGLLDNVYNNIDVLGGLHANTTIPKFLGCAAAYEITGDEYYKTVCVNAYEMIMTRLYAFGGTSIGEHWRDSGVVNEALDSAETCCSYNMLKLADYLFRWTGDKKYADYYENVYTNHILASMDPDSGGKTYLTNTAFGYYKIYHTADNSFWCCACSGMENFAQLPQGMYYTDKDKTVVRVNMFYPSEYEMSDNISIKQTGDFYTNQKTALTVNGNGTFTLALRIPDWAEKGYTVKINGVEFTATANSGYAEIDREWHSGDTVEYSVPFAFRLDNLDGHDRSYALEYGPIVLVADLGNDDVHDIQGNQMSFGAPYTGNIVNKIQLGGEISDCAVARIVGGEIEVTVKTLNQGDLIFRPFNRVFHSRYGMYFDYYAADEDVDGDYTVKGNETGSEFDGANNLDMFAEFGSTGGGRMFAVENGWLVSPSQGENKLMAGVALGGSFVIDVKLAPYTADAAMNGGVYLMASGAGKNQDMITAYNVQIERAAKSPMYSLSVFKFDGAFLGTVTSATLTMPDDGIIELHILVKDGAVSVFVNGSRNASVKFDIDPELITYEKGDVGIRSQVSRMKFDSLRIISADLPVGKDVLKSAVSVAEGIDCSAYVSSGAARLEGALSTAKSLLSNDVATQEKVNAANSELRNALAALETIGDRTAVDIAYAAALKLDRRNYTESSFEAVTAVLSAIETTDLSDVSQAVMDALLNDLAKAVMSLTVKNSDKAALDAVTDAAALIDKVGYTEESYAVLVAAVERAKALGDDATSAQIDAAIIDILKAQTKLVPVQTTDGDRTDNNVGSADEREGGGNGLAIAAIAVSSVMLAAVIALGTTLILRRKKSKNNQAENDK